MTQADSAPKSHEMRFVNDQKKCTVAFQLLLSFHLRIRDILLPLEGNWKHSTPECRTETW